VSIVQIFQNQNEIQVCGGTLHPTHGESETADQGIPDTLPGHGLAQLLEHFEEIHRRESSLFLRLAAM
jgi:hypothetical protein